MSPITSPTCFFQYTSERALHSQAPGLRWLVDAGELAAGIE
jgi:hypothetical protein